MGVQVRLPIVFGVNANISKAFDVQFDLFVVFDLRVDHSILFDFENYLDFDSEISILFLLILILRLTMFWANRALGHKANVFSCISRIFSLYTSM